MRDTLRPAAPVLERDKEGPWVTVKAPTQETPPTQVGKPVTLISGDEVLYEMRTKPHLYEDWMRDLQEDCRAAIAEREDLFDWDCHRCQKSVFTQDLSDRCPSCGWKW